MCFEVLICEKLFQSTAKLVLVNLFFYFDLGNYIPKNALMLLNFTA